MSVSVSVCIRTYVCVYVYVHMCVCVCVCGIYMCVLESHLHAVVIAVPVYLKEIPVHEEFAAPDALESPPNVVEYAATARTRPNHYTKLFDNFVRMSTIASRQTNVGEGRVVVGDVLVQMFVCGRVCESQNAK